MQTRMSRIGLIDANPYRARGDLAFRDDALEALDRSLKAHGIWSPLPVRSSSTAPGRFELVFGHHRLEALRRMHGDDHELEVEVLELTDTQMLQRMAAENGPEYASDALTYMQQVRATVHAFAEGRVELDQVPPRTRRKGVRCAPSFVPLDDRSTQTDHQRSKAFTANTVGAFLGYTTSDARGRTVAKSWVKEVLLALEAVERGEIDEAAFRNATLTQMRRLRLAAHRKTASQSAAVEHAPAGTATASETTPSIDHQQQADASNAAADAEPAAPPGHLAGPPAAQLVQRALAHRPGDPRGHERSRKRRRRRPRGRAGPRYGRSLARSPDVLALLRLCLRGWATNATPSPPEQANHTAAHAQGAPAAAPAASPVVAHSQAREPESDYDLLTWPETEDDTLTLCGVRLPAMLAIHGLTMYLGLVPLPMARRGPTGFDRELWRLLNTLDSVVASLTGRPLTSKDPRRRRQFHGARPWVGRGR